VIFAISPYDLTRDSPALLAGAMLADRLVTLLPAPLEGATAEAITKATNKHPAFVRYIESSRWLSPLWHAGVLIPGPMSEQGPHAAILDDARAICARVLADDSLASLRCLVDPGAFQNSDAYLSGIARDLLLGGVSPGFVVTVCAAIDRFAARHAIPSIRCENASSVSTAERRKARPFLRVSVPVPRSAEGEEMLRIRERLDSPLRSARIALSNALSDPENREAEHGLRESIARIEDAFASHSPHGARTVVLAFSTQPSDRSLAIAGAASRSLSKSAAHTNKCAPADVVPQTALDLPPCLVVSARFVKIDVG